MKNKIIGIVALVAVLAVLFALGATGLVSLSGKDGGQSEQKDGRMIGVYLMWENETISELAWSGERFLYAERKTVTDENGYESVEYVFEQLSGIPFYNISYTDDMGEHVVSLIGTDKISRIQSHYADGDAEHKTSHEGTLYYCSRQGRMRLWMYNVRQASDESVYIDTEEMPELVILGDYGHSIIHSETQFQTMGKQKETYDFSIKVEFARMAKPDGTGKLIEMDLQNRVVAETTVEIGENMPEAVLNRDTAYVIVEQHLTDADGNGQIERRLYTRENESAEVYSVGGDGICSLRYLPLVWQ